MKNHPTPLYLSREGWTSRPGGGHSTVDKKKKLLFWGCGAHHHWLRASVTAGWCGSAKCGVGQQLARFRDEDLKSWRIKLEKVKIIFPVFPCTIVGRDHSSSEKMKGQFRNKQEKKKKRVTNTHFENFYVDECVCVCVLCTIKYTAHPSLRSAAFNGHHIARRVPEWRPDVRIRPRDRPDPSDHFTLFALPFSCSSEASGRTSGCGRTTVSTSGKEKWNGDGKKESRAVFACPTAVT